MSGRGQQVCRPEGPKLRGPGEMEQRSARGGHTGGSGGQDVSPKTCTPILETGD